MSRRHPARAWVFFAVLLAGAMSLHWGRNLRDARDWDLLERKELPVGFQTDPSWASFREEVLARPLFEDPDSFYWVGYASEMAKTHRLRLNWTQKDNPPAGRPVHWSNGFLWWLMGLGKVRSVFTGESWTRAIEGAASWTNPITLTLAILFWSIAVALRFNPLAGGFTGILIAGLASVQPDLRFASVDHHAVQDLLAVSQVLALVLGGAGWVRSETPTGEPTGLRRRIEPLSFGQARLWFAAGGIFGAGGLWVGASQESMIIAGCGLAGAAGALLFSRADREPIRRAPLLWRYWSWTGAAVALLLYFVQYGSEGSGMRLEVNHPLYALTWLAAGELIFRLDVLHTERRFPEAGERGWILALGLAGLALPAALWMGPDSWHNMKDPSMARIHEFIHEFHGVVGSLLGNLRSLLASMGLFLLTLPMGLACLFTRSLRSFQRSLVLTAWLPGLIVGVWFYFQIRWEGMAASLGVVLAVALLSALGPSGRALGSRRRRTAPWIAGLVAAAVVGSYLWENFGSDASLAHRFSGIFQSVVIRDVALNLRRNNGQDGAVVVGDPTLSAGLPFFGAGKGVGSLYWENLDGLKAAAEILSAPNIQSIIPLIKQRGVTHLVAQPGNFNLAKMMHYTHYGEDPPFPWEKTLAAYLAGGRAGESDWLIEEPMLESKTSAMFNFRIYRIRTELLEDTGDVDD